MTDTDTIAGLGAHLSGVAALVADPTRARMLSALMDGRALTATELALAGGVAPSTASGHLARLSRAGLLAPERQGRHRYYRIARAEVAEALEELGRFAAPVRAVRVGPHDERLRHARVCYDHLAGSAGVRLLDGLLRDGLVASHDGALALAPAGERWVERLGLDLPALRRARRPLCRPCLDWSERRPHLAGSLGAAVLEWC